MKITLEVGDIVRLKSGGPRMTVILIVVSKSGERYHCGWFDGEGKNYTISEFYGATLHPIDL